MSTERVTAQQKIILATIECIEKNGINSLTVRDIAETAGVNVAAISYYFGSKANLLDTALRVTMDEAFLETEELLRDPNTDPYLALKGFLENTIWGSMNSPGVTKAHLFNPIYDKDKNNYSFTRIKDFMQLLVDRLAAKGDHKERKRIRFAIVQMISAVVMVGLIPELFEQAAGTDFHEDKIQKDFVAQLMESSLGK
jgi:TetR/AcrR family transcriptional regulator, regulator of cefoperazone and chloramphenicol sensitivity